MWFRSGEAPLIDGWVVPSFIADFWYRAFQTFLLEKPALRQLAQLFGGETALSASAEERRMVQARAINLSHFTMNGELKSVIALAADAYARSQLPSLPDPKTLSVPKDLTDLRHQGFAFLDPLPDDRLSVLQHSLAEAPLYRNAECLQGGAQAVREEILRKEENIAQVGIETLLALPGLAEMVCDPALLDCVATYLGAQPILINVSAWTSFAGGISDRSARDAQHFHADCDDHRFCKVFFYLSDVDEDCGPHVYVPETHRADFLKARIPKQDTEAAQAYRQWYAEVLRKTEADVVRYMGVTPKRLTGPAGTCFIADTTGIHRGAVPRKQDRKILQFVYGVTPFCDPAARFRPVSPRRWDGSEITETDAGSAYTLCAFYPGLTHTVPET